MSVPQKHREKRNLKIKKEFEQLQPVTEFVNGFKDHEVLEHFLNLCKNAEAVKLPPGEGSFVELSVPDEISKTIDSVIKKTGKKTKGSPTRNN